MTYPNGKVLNYNYGSSGSLADTLSRLDSLSDTSGTLEQYTYLGGDKVVQRARSQINIHLTYIKQTGESNGDAGDQYTGLDRFGRVVDQRWIITTSGSHTDRFQYGYDRDSNALYRNNLLNTAFGELYHASGAGNGYDSLNQLSGFLRGVLSASGGSGTPLDTVSSPSHSQSWSPDALGNFSSVTTDGTTQTRTHNQQNEITAISGATTPTFDTNGNLTKDEIGQTYTYDAWNRLVQVKNSDGTAIASYKYDAIGRRIQETHSGTTTDLYFSDQWQVLEERTGGVSTATIQYVWSPVYVDALVLRDRSTANNGTLDERLWVQQDANWNVTALVNNSGSVVERYIYDAYGQVTYLNANWATISGSAYASIYGFQGLRLDTVTGNDNGRGREYRPTLGRWIQVDPKTLEPDVNWYRLVADAPTERTDPTGLDNAMGGSFQGAGMPSMPGGTYVRPPAPSKPGGGFGGDWQLYMKRPLVPVDVTFPEPGEGCSGWCFQTSGSRVVAINITKAEFSDGCSFVLRHAPNLLVEGEIKKMVQQKDGFSINTCSNGCTCQNKKNYDGQLIRLNLNGNVIPLDPAFFDPPANRFKKGECSVTVTGSIVLAVGKGWVGTCAKA